MPGQSVKGGTSNGSPPHSRHIEAVRITCQVGSTPLTPVTSCQLSKRQHLRAPARAGGEPALIIGLVLAVGQLLGVADGVASEASSAKQERSGACARLVDGRKIDK